MTSYEKGPRQGVLPRYKEFFGGQETVGRPLTKRPEPPVSEFRQTSLGIQARSATVWLAQSAERWRLKYPSKTEALFPDLTNKELLEAIDWKKIREQRRGNAGLEASSWGPGASTIKAYRMGLPRLLRQIKSEDPERKILPNQFWSLYKGRERFVRNTLDTLCQIAMLSLVFEVKGFDSVEWLETKNDQLRFRTDVTYSEAGQLLEAFLENQPVEISNPIRQAGEAGGIIKASIIV